MNKTTKEKGSRVSRRRCRGALTLACAALLLACTAINISGCARHAAKEATGNIGGIDISKRIELVVYMLGDAPKDLDLVESEINKMCIEELNCTVSFKYTSWSDYMQRYSLLVASGQPIDLIFTSEWLNYNQFAKKGAFMELDELLPRYAPSLYAFVPNDYWNAVRIGGHIYTIPSTWKEYVNEGFMYRDDLRKKYALPVPDSLANIESYLEGIRKREPNRNITSEIAVDNGYGPSFSVTSVLNLKYHWVDLCMPYGLSADYDKPGELTTYWGSKDFIDDMKMFKRWADKGFWTKSALSNKNPMNDLFNSGYSIAVMSGINPIKYAHSLALMKSLDPSVEVGYYPYCRATKLVKPVHPTHNGFAIPLGARNPERALMLYEKLVLDKRYNRLTQYGIEGKHYRVDQDGYYEMIGTADTNGFPHEAMNGWAWRNPGLMLFDRNAKEAFDLFREFDGYAQPDIFYGFVEDYSPYQAERAALYQVQSQYLVPIQAGMVDDVDRAVKEFMAQANAAGLQKIQREYKKQWLAYCAEKGIK